MASDGPGGFPLEGTIGKAELLRWAQEQSGVECRKFEDLRSGVVLLRLFDRIWPNTRLASRKWKPNPRTEYDINSNWELLRTLVGVFKLPTWILDKRGIQSSRFSACHNFLVMLFFLQNLSLNQDFSVDFEHGVDGRLATFLQGSSSLEALVVGGAMSWDDLGGGPPDEDEAGAAAHEESVTGHPVTDDDSMADLPPEPAEYPVRTNAAPARAAAEPAAPEKAKKRAASPRGSPDFPASKIPVPGGRRSPDQRPRSPEEPIPQPRQRPAAPVSEREAPGVSQPPTRGPRTAGTPEEVAVQTDLDVRRLENIMIRNMNGRKENIELRKELDQVKARVTAMGKGKVPSPAPATRDRDGTSWKTPQAREVGEVLLRRAKLEIESLGRQLELVKQEKEYEVNQSESRARILGTRLENERRLHREMIEAASSSAEMARLALQAHEKQNYSLELRHLESEIAFESDRIRDGGIAPGDDEEIEQELLHLRQLRAIHSRQIKALQETNTTLREQNDVLQGSLRKEQEKAERLHRHYSTQDEEVNGIPRGQDAAAEAADTNPSERVDGLTRRERQLAVQAKNLRSELDMTKVRHARLMEEARHELEALRGKIDAGKGIGDGEREFEQQQALQRAQSELEALHKRARFLQERAVLFDEQNTAAGRPSYHLELDTVDRTAADPGEDGADAEYRFWLPEAEVEVLREGLGGSAEEEGDGDKEAIVDINVRVHAALAALKREAGAAGGCAALADLEGLFWRMVSAENILARRVKRARGEIVTLHTAVETAKIKLLEERDSVEKHVSDLTARNRLEVFGLHESAIKEKAMLQVRLDLSQAQLRDLQEEIEEVHGHLARARENARQADEGRHIHLLQKLRESRDEGSRYRIREELWQKLVETQRRFVKVTETLCNTDDYDEVFRLTENREQLDREASGLIEQINALSSSLATSRDAAGDGDAEKSELEDLIAEATALLKSQMKGLSEDLETVKLENKKHKSEITDLALQLRRYQLDIDSHQRKAKFFEEEKDNAEAGRLDALADMRRRDEFEQETVADLRARLSSIIEHNQELQWVSKSVQGVASPAQPRDVTRWQKRDRVRGDASPKATLVADAPKPGLETPEVESSSKKEMRADVEFSLKATVVESGTPSPEPEPTRGASTKSAARRREPKAESLVEGKVRALEETLARERELQRQLVDGGSPGQFDEGFRFLTGGASAADGGSTAHPMLMSKASEANLRPTETVAPPPDEEIHEDVVKHASAHAAFVDRSHIQSFSPRSSTGKLPTLMSSEAEKDEELFKPVGGGTM